MNVSNVYFIHQVMTIVALFVSGLLFLLLTDGAQSKNNKVSILVKAILAYPAGLSIWGILGFLILVVGIPYNALTMMIAHALLFAILLFNFICKMKARLLTSDLKICGFAIAIAIMVAIVCCLGFITVSVSNDSYYYYSLYPQTIVIEGGYNTSFDVFLTDVGQTSAIIGTLPFLFAFEETYGIMLFLGANLVVIFAYAIYDISTNRWKVGRKGTILAVTLSVTFLVSSTPFIVMTKWVLANAYFMALGFTLFYIMYRFSFHENERGILPFVALLTAMVSMLRMEGGMMAGLLILCILSLTVKGADIMKYMTVPVAITQALYYANVYLKLTVNPLYSFLDFKNAFIMLAFAVALIVYAGFIRERISPFIKRNYAYILILLLVAGNIVLLFVDKERYLTNLEYLILNIYNKTGWGMFGYLMAFFFFMIFMLRIIGVIRHKTRRKWSLSYSLTFSIGFVLFTLAVCFARDGSLRLGIGDSGNRVLMQIVPFAVFALVEEVLSYFSLKCGLE